MIQKKTPVVAITGASGFLGKELVRYFIDQKWQVIGLVRNEPAVSKTKKLQYRNYDIGKSLSADTLKNVDYVVHTAYVKLSPKNPDAKDINIAGAMNLISAIKKSSVKKTVFISTMSAHEDAISVYGIQKLNIENLFLATKKAVVLRAGLIIGNGGIVRDMATFMKTKHAVPLIGGGEQPLQVISVFDLVKVIHNSLELPLKGRFVAATPRVYSYKEFYKALAKRLDVKVLYIPLPYFVLESIFKLAATLHISLGVGEDNLKGLRMLKSMPSEADLMQIGVNPVELEAALQKTDIKG